MNFDIGHLVAPIRPDVCLYYHDRRSSKIYRCVIIATDGVPTVPTFRGNTCNMTSDQYFAVLPVIQVVRLERRGRGINLYR